MGDQHVCPNCGCSINKNYHSSKYNKYCSKQCWADYQWVLKKKYIEETGYVLKTPNAHNDTAVRCTAKRYLIEKYGHKCMICGVEKWLGNPVMLICDHINGDPTNYEINNFRIICPNCDATLPTFTNRNKGNGRRSKGMVGGVY